MTTPNDSPDSETENPSSEEAQAPEGAAAKKAAASDEPEIPQPRSEEVVPVLEGLLFATTVPLTIKRLQYLTGNLEVDEINGALNELRERYSQQGSGLMLMEVASGFQLATRATISDWVLALHKHRRKNPISPAVMETLAIVAYKQPLVKAEIESIRGVDCGGVMRSLLDAGLIEVVGTKEVVGRPSLYGTSESFLKTFGLKSLEELPSIFELREILETPMKGKEAEEEKDTVDDSEESPEQVQEEPVAEPDTELAETIIEDSDVQPDAITEDMAIDDEPETREP